MKEAVLKKVVIKNFKGHKDLELDFKEGVNNIRANNHRGKTSLVDAIIFCHLGINSLGESVFNAKPTKDGEQIEGLETYIICDWLVDGDKLSFKRELKDEYTRKDEQGNRRLKGNKTIYSIGEFEVSAKAFNEKIDDVFGGDLLYMLISPMFFFNKTKGSSIDTEWQRNKVIEISEHSTNDQILEKLGEYIDYKFIIDYLDQGKSLSEIKEMLTKKISKLKKERDDIDPVVDYKKNNLPEETNVSSLKRDLKNKEEELKEIEYAETDIKKRVDQILESNKAITEKISQCNKLLDAISNEVEKEAEKPVYEAKNAKLKLEEGAIKIKKEIDSLELKKQDTFKALTDLKNQKESLVSEFTLVKKSEVSVLPEGKCPLNFTPCDSLLQSHSENVKKHVEKFNEEKVQKLKDINKKGLDLKEKIKSTESELDVINHDIETYRNQHSVLINKINKHVIPEPEKVDLESDSRYKEQQKKLNELKAKLSNQVDLKPPKENPKKEELKNDIDELKLLISKSSERDEELLEIKNLIKSKSDKSDIIGVENKKLDLLNEFVDAKMELIEESVNKKMSLIKFKMFFKQMNGSIKTGLKALLNGVPYQSCSTSEKTYIGLDFISVVSKEKDVCYPVIIDNRESTVNIPEMNNQVINLFVDDRYDELTIDS